jgi:hypothetical protein
MHIKRSMQTGTQQIIQEEVLSSEIDCLQMLFINLGDLVRVHQRLLLLLTDT